MRANELIFTVMVSGVFRHFYRHAIHRLGVRGKELRIIYFINLAKIKLRIKFQKLAPSLEARLLLLVPNSMKVLNVVVKRSAREESLFIFKNFLVQ